MGKAKADSSAEENGSMEQKIAWKIYMGLIGAVTTIAAQKLITAAWKAATGEEPPTATNPDIPLRSAVSWAIASGVGIGVTQLLTTRFAARRFAHLLGGPTPKVPNIKLKI